MDFHLYLLLPLYSDPLVFGFLSQPVSAIQLSLSSQANYITGVTVVQSDYMDFSDWYFGGNQDGADYNVIITDLTLNNPIMPGMGHIADLYLYVDASTPSGNSYPIEVDKIIADANSIAMYTEMISSSVFVGTPMAHFSIDTSFSLVISRILFFLLKF